MLFFCPILRRVGFFSELLISLFSNSEVCLRPSCSGGQGLYHFSNGKKDKQWALLGKRGPCWCWLSSDAALLREGLCCVVSPPPCPALPRHVQLFPPMSSSSLPHVQPFPPPPTAIHSPSSVLCVSGRGMESKLLFYRRAVGAEAMCIL